MEDRVITMSEKPVQSTTVRMRLAGEPVELTIKTPAGPVQVREMLRVFHSLTDVLVSAATREVQKQGKKVSCRAHCGACCRQIVPITEAETHWIRDLVERLPEPRRNQIRHRFADALERLAAAGILEELRHRGPRTDEEVLSLANRYVELEIACPFLEDESCSIHPDRPMMCREYLVTSPAENCGAPGPRQIECVPMPVRVSSVVARLGREVQPGERPLVPLILALEWAEAHRDETARRPGPEILENLLRRLAGEH